MFIHETGGYDGSEQSLFLLQAIPRELLKPGSRLAVSKMGTWFGGTVDLSLSVGKDGRRIEATLRLHNQCASPTGMRLRLRSSDGSAISTVTVNGKPAHVELDGLVTLEQKRNGAYTIVAEVGHPAVH
jgi:hypothetical protein